MRSLQLPGLPGTCCAGTAACPGRPRPACSVAPDIIALPGAGAVLAAAAQAHRRPRLRPAAALVAIGAVARHVAGPVAAEAEACAEAEERQRSGSWVVRPCRGAGGQHRFHASPCSPAAVLLHPAPQVAAPALPQGGRAEPSARAAAAPLTLGALARVVAKLRTQEAGPLLGRVGAVARHVALAAALEAARAGLLVVGVKVAAGAGAAANKWDCGWSPAAVDL